MGEGINKSKAPNSAFVAFFPFGMLAVYLLHGSVPLRWVSLASLLQSLSFLSICSNLMINDMVWSAFSLWAFIMVSTPIYLSTMKTINNKNPVRQGGKITLPRLFKTCCNGVFSDYRISLMSKIPFVIQVFAAGSVLYSIFGLDWLLHSLAGFGVGTVALKAYKTSVKSYGYVNLASYFRLDRFKAFRTERKHGAAEWTLFSLIVVTLLWELMERVVYFISPTNVLRIGFESLWNSTGDIIFGILGGMLAWYLIEHRFRWA